MFTSEDILARLQNGDSVDEIATEMANALNAAKTSYDEAEAKRIEEEKKIAEAQAKMDAENQKKRTIIQRIVDAFADYAELVGKQDIADKLDAMEDNDLDDLVEAIDAMLELAEMTEKLKVLEYGNPFGFMNPVGMKNLPKPVQKAVKPTPDDIISEFLKTL